MAPKKKKEKEKIQAVIDKLQEDLQKQEENQKQVMQRLLIEKDTWLANCSPSFNQSDIFLALFF